MSGAADEPFYTGKGFTLSNPTPDVVVYAERRRRWSFLAIPGATPPRLGIPRPELWDFGVPSWLRGRYEVVKDRLIEHSGHEVVFGRQEQYVDAVRTRLRRFGDPAERRRRACPTCDADVVTTLQTEPSNTQGWISILPTHAAVQERVDDGRFEVIRADATIPDMLTLLRRESKLTIISFLRCTVSDETIFWGFSIRGAPIYRHEWAAAPFTWPWNGGHPVIDNAPARP